jgi:transposase-like protein
VPYNHKRKVAAALKPIYTAPHADAAEAELERFDQTWGQRYPLRAQAWRRNWEHITPLLALPDELRRVLYGEPPRIAVLSGVARDRNPPEPRDLVRHAEGLARFDG